jgi:hypothetical protein
MHTDSVRRDGVELDTLIPLHDNADPMNSSLITVGMAHDYVYHATRFR